MDDIFVDLHLVSGIQQRVELLSELMLAGCNFVMMLLHRDAHGKRGGDHLGADVGQ